MRWRPRAITALLAFACAAGIACGGSGHGSTTIVTRPSFPQGFLPVLLGGPSGRGDVVFREDGDLFAVAGTPDLWVVSRETGGIATHHFSGAGSLLSITAGSDPRLFAGDDAGTIWAISGDGSPTSPFAAEPFVVTGNGRITGLAFAPSGFGDLGGSLLAATELGGIRRIAIGETTSDNPFAAGDFVDLAFSGDTLFAIEQVDPTHGEIDTVSSSGSPTLLQSGFVAPVGIAVDSNNSEIYVADAGDGVLYTVPITGGAPTPRAAYEFDATAPSGIAYDGIGAIAFITTDPPAIRGSTVPQINPANTNFGRNFIGPTVGYGDLELDRAGAFVLAANKTDDPDVADDSIGNFLFGASRDLNSVTILASDVGPPITSIEELLGVAVDPYGQVTYVSTRSGKVYKRDAEGIVTELVPGGLTNVPVLGLELAPAGFDDYGGWLFATTDINTVADPDTGEVFAIDPQNPTQFVKIALSEPVAHLSDLVFSTDGVLYLVENKESTSRILRVSVTGTTGTVTELSGPSVPLGRADGIEIDEGGNRLLVASETAGGGQLLAVDRSSGAVTAALANFDISRGFFPTGVVYDRLGTAVVRQGNTTTSLKAAPVALP